MKLAAPFLLFGILTSGCASLRGGWRLSVGTLSGAAIGAGGGALLSPNAESRALNALVFGLGGALVGGGLAWLTDPAPNEDTGPGLKERELMREADAKRSALIPTGNLPPFVKDRISPMVIEEANERDAVSEDGTLHEPHRVYRIIKPAELYANPAESSPTQKGAKR